MLSTLRPNEIAEVSYIGPCTSVSAEKWMTRTVQHVMAGDEDGDTTFFEPTLFGSIDALMSTQNWVAPVPFSNQRTIYWSPTTELNLAISGPAFRSGDVGRIGAGGQAERFITQEQFNMALGLPSAPFSPFCFPDLYTTSLIPWFPMAPGFGQFPMVNIPPAWLGKVLYQAVGWGGTFELSTPAVVDVN